MSWPSPSSDSASETVERESVVTASEPWDAQGAGRGADEGDWFGAFYVPRAAPELDDPPSFANGIQEPIDEQLQNCISCGTSTNDLRRLSCGHMWCCACLTARVELALRWEGDWPARCCNNVNDVELRSLAPFLGEVIVERYLDKYDEMETPRDQRIYCADPRCSTFLGRRGTRIHLDSCRKCNTLTCLACGSVEQLHDNNQCPSVAETTVSHQNLIRSGKLQQCPSCPEVVELRDACNHIT